MARFERSNHESTGPGSSDDYSRPPTTVETLTAVFRHLRIELERRKLPWPAEIPDGPEAACWWWIGLQEPPHPKYDTPYTVSVISQSNGATRWECPYHNRLAANLRRYCSLPENQRMIIQAAKDDGVFWRGDEIQQADGSPGLFIAIYDETLKMREVGIEAYKSTHSIAKLRGAAINATRHG